MIDSIKEIEEKKEQSIICNKDAIVYFNSAMKFFNLSNFNEAKNYISKYKECVDYNSFFRNDTRIVENPIVSVIVVGYNTKKKLIDCINSVIKNNTDNNYEIIVIDNGENEEVINTLLTYKILYVANPFNFNLSEGRNIGAFFAKGKIVAFLDDDALVERNYIDSMVQLFIDCSIIGMRGKILSKTDSVNNKKAVHYNLGDYDKYINLIGSEANSAFSLNEYKKINGMNPLLFGHEGIEISYRIENTYGTNKIMYSANTVIHHDYASADDKLIIKNNRHEFMNKYLQYLHPHIGDFINLFVIKEELFNKNNELNKEIEKVKELEKKVFYMEKSRFWKLRNFILKFKIL